MTSIKDNIAATTDPAAANDLTVELRDPSDTLVTSFPANADAGPFVLLNSGVHTLRVRGNTGSSTGTYAFTFLDLNVNSTSLSFGATQSATLTPSTRTDVFRVSGAVGQRVVYDAIDADLDTNFVSLYSPSLALVLSGNTDADQAPLTLGESGTYYLLVRGGEPSGAPDYAFRLLNASAAPTITLGADVNASLNPGRQSQVYRLSAAADQRLYFNGLTSSGAANWTLYSPSNQQVTTTSFHTDFELNVAGAGEYLVVFSGQQAGAVSASFRVSSPAITSAALTLGATVNDAPDVFVPIPLPDKEPAA